MEKKDLFLAHYFVWDFMPLETIEAIFAEFRDNGCCNLVFCDYWCRLILKDPLVYSRIKRAAFKQNIAFREIHSPFGEAYDLACASNARRPGMIHDQITCMRYAADFGCPTYTLHIGAYDSVHFQKPNSEIRPLVIDALEKLLPEAEKLGLTIAVENAFERCNTPDEVMYYINYFNHPNLGCCFDAGHACMMASYPDKKQEDYPANIRDTVWGGFVEEYNGAFEKMAPAIVTCHLHENSGVNDTHSLPGLGRINWQELAGKILTQAPRLKSVQSEVNGLTSGISVRKLCDKFREIFPSLPVA